jgi:hypothetical protein
MTPPFLLEKNMACNTLANRFEPCKEFAGGLRGVFLVPYAFGDVVTKDAGGLVTSINDGASPTPANSTAYFFELKGLSTLEISGGTSRDNGTTAYTQTLTLSLKPSGSTPASADSDAELFDTLTKGRWRVIAWEYGYLDRNGNHKKSDCGCRELRRYVHRCDYICITLFFPYLKGALCPFFVI